MKFEKVRAFKTIRDTEDVIRSAVNGKRLVFSLGDINTTHGAFRDVARLQALVSVSRLSTDKNLNIQSKVSIQDLLSEITRYAPGLTAIRLNKSLSTESLKISRRDALLSAVQKMNFTDRSDFKQVVKGRSLDLCCISGAALQYLSPIFDQKNSNGVKDSQGMMKTMASIFKYIEKDGYFDLDAELNQAFGVFACELFNNTQEHACSDEHDTPYVEHVEGIIASGQPLDCFHREDFEGHPRLIKYWEREVTNNNSQRERLKCRQISFFDTGPGLVSRAFPDASFDSAEQEKEALMKCIGKYFTSKSQSGAGQGYSMILTHLKRVGGLIRIRTGNLSVFNCFDESESCEQQNSLLNFDNWTQDSLSKAQGTTVSILVPLRNESGQSILF